MQIEVESRPSYGMAIVTLEAGEQLLSESGAMVAMNSTIAVDTKFNGTGDGFFGWLKAALVGMARKFLAGESLFVNEFTATASGQLNVPTSSVSGPASPPATVVTVPSSDT